jgi:hypothetical protein
MINSLARAELHKRPTKAETKEELDILAQELARIKVEQDDLKDKYEAIRTKILSDMKRLFGDVAAEYEAPSGIKLQIQKRSSYKLEEDSFIAALSPEQREKIVVDIPQVDPKLLEAAIAMGIIDKGKVDEFTTVSITSALNCRFPKKVEE